MRQEQRNGRLLDELLRDQSVEEIRSRECAKAPMTVSPASTFWASSSKASATVSTGHDVVDLSVEPEPFERLDRLRGELPATAPLSLTVTT